MHASWAGLPPANREYNLQSSASWFKHWTREFKSSPPPDPAEGSVERYRLLAEETLAAEAHLPDVTAVQQAILTAMSKGATFSTAHKEGGTRISRQGARFVRADYGESDRVETFNGEADFLAFIRKFYDWETSKSVYPDKVPDFDAWRLILRLLRWERR